jgi:integrase
MPTQLKNHLLQHASNRLALPVAAEPVWQRIGEGISLGYRRTTSSGRWCVRGTKGDGTYWKKAFADADDHQAANGATILDYWQAQDKAREVARGAPTAAAANAEQAQAQAPITVAQALDGYLADLKARNGDVENILKVKRDLTPALANRLVGGLTARELRAFRDKLAKRKVVRRGGTTGTSTIKPATVNRNTAVFKAALSRAASLDRRITNAKEWEIGLAALAGGNVARNAIIADDDIRAIVDAAFIAVDLGGFDLGCLAQVCAETGTRVSQATRLLVDDFRMGAKPLLMLPVSKKGKGAKAISHHPTPISSALAQRLQARTRGKKSTDLLLTNGALPWGKSGHNRAFAKAVKRAGLSGVSIIAFRHSSIVRQLLASVPVRVVAVNHDTSVKMIETNYSKFIGSHTEDLTRAALVDLTANPAASNVVGIRNG